MNFDLEYDFAEAIRRQGRKQSDVDELRASMLDIAVIPKSITNKQVNRHILHEIFVMFLLKCIIHFSKILLFLDSCGTIENATRVAKKYYEFKKSSPEHFQLRDPQHPKIQQCFGHQDYINLPNLPNGDLLIFHRLSSSRSGDYVFDEAIKTFFMLIGEKICFTFLSLLLLYYLEHKNF